MHKGIISERDRRDQERERRIAKGRAVRAAETARAETLVAEAGRTGNGGPPDLKAAAEVRAIGELLYGSRWVTELAEIVAENPRQIRRWLAGDAEVPRRALAWARQEARKRAAALIGLVGEEA
ncbi:hypothetical protein MMSR116_16165 [Methylobacterium mesophilicum SR1.6/6]|uniref:Uncharacterized protein n=1 Tax=Methylobacterium mesophilicum SR1.6/6 TaxID=908290 RepID=A0A6B9FLH1_9HYPH|nr:hypothetical protein [Methylobacterium mesophilicum]QGY03247.1 hypothetical protein MMSR116_16165 [Methylobacterium mesophilicum SR1.6/6]